jgi:hypothetical protein
MSATFEGFSASLLPFEVALSLKESHWITSCKVLYPLKQRYWERSAIPQVISTDTFLQDVYGIALTTPTHHDPGVILVSYTWEDDAAKLEAVRDDALLRVPAWRSSIASYCAAKISDSPSLPMSITTAIARLSLPMDDDRGLAGCEAES